LEIWRKEQRELVFAPSVTSVLRRQLQVFCAARYKRFAPTVTSVLRRQLQAFCAVRYKRHVCCLGAKLKKAH